MNTCKKLLIGWLVLLSACGWFEAPPTARPTLPGKLVVYDVESKAFLQYGPEGEKAFIPVTGYSMPEFSAREGYEPAVSPDGQWTIAFEEPLHRFVITGSHTSYTIEDHVLSLDDTAWSPDSQYLAYTANDQQGEWAGRVTVLSLADGTKAWIGTGIYPRWYP